MKTLMSNSSPPPPPAREVRARPAAAGAASPSRPVPDPWNAACPSRAVIGLLADKWVLLLVPLLRRGPQRNGDLLRGAEGVSQKMLTQTLRELERHGLVARHDYREVPPRVEYTLTPLGHSLADAVVALDDWVVRHYYEMADAAAPAGRRRGRLSARERPAV